MAPIGGVTADRRAIDEAASVFVSPEAYADDEVFHDACALLRRSSPITRVDAEGYPVFWAITKHADVWEIATHSDEFHNAPRSMLMTFEREEAQRALGEPRSLIHLDGEEHRDLRHLAIDWFKPGTLRRLEGQLADLASRSVDRMLANGGECDFVHDVAVPLPLEVILSTLGLPESDYDVVLKLTQEVFGSDDPDLARQDSEGDAFAAAVSDMLTYFGGVIAERQARPTDDLASVIANGTIGGKPIDLIDQLYYFTTIATAGHDTTTAALSGGMRALIEHPDQLERLRSDPTLLPSAVEEIIRWVTPVKHFMRNATVPYVVGGHAFEPGDCVLLSYPSANRDEDVFDDPSAFDVGRSPNRHLAFGFGAHYCLGASLARLEIKALLGELLPRLQSIELAGEPQTIKTLFVGGHRTLPIRYELTS